MHDFFISHSSLDKIDIVDDIFNNLIERGYKVWYDKEEIVLGDNITSKVEKGLNESLCVILILTENFFGSQWTYFEIGNISVSKKRRIIPICYSLSDNQKLEITRMLGNLKYIDSSSGILNIISESSKTLREAKIQNESLIIKSRLHDIQKRLNTFENMRVSMISVRLKEYIDFMEKHIEYLPLSSKKLVSSLVVNIAQYKNIAPDMDEYNYEGQKRLVAEHYFFGQNIREQILYLYSIDERNFTETMAEVTTRAVIGVLEWYLSIRYTMSINTKNLETVNPEELKYSDFIQMFEIDKLVLREDLIANTQSTYNWYLYNNYTHLALRDADTDTVIGYFAVLPITDDTYKKIVDGDFKDKDFTENDIRLYDFQDFYKVYVAAVAIHPDYQNTNAFTKLFSALIDMFMFLARESDILISEIIAEASTKQGEKFCKIMGMKKGVRTLSDTDIYSLILIPPEFKIKNKKEGELYKLYKQKIEELRNNFNI